MHRSAVVVTTLAVVLGATVAHGQTLSGEYKIGVLEPLTGSRVRSRARASDTSRGTRSCAT